MKFTKNWRPIIKAYSTLILGALTFLGTAYAVTPELQALIPPMIIVKAASAVSLFGLIGRFIEQPDIQAALAVVLPADAVQEIGQGIADAAAQAAQDKGNEAVQAAVDSLKDAGQ